MHDVTIWGYVENLLRVVKPNQAKVEKHLILHWVFYFSSDWPMDTLSRALFLMCGFCIYVISPRYLNYPIKFINVDDHDFGLENKVEKLLQRQKQIAYEWRN